MIMSMKLMTFQSEFNLKEAILFQPKQYKSVCVLLFRILLLQPYDVHSDESHET